MSMRLTINSGQDWGGDRGSREAREATGRTWQNKRAARGQGKQREVSRLTRATTTDAGGWGGHKRPQPCEKTQGLTEGREGRVMTAGGEGGGEGGAGGTRIARQDVGSHSPMGNAYMPTGQIAVHGLIIIYAVQCPCGQAIFTAFPRGHER